MEAAGLDSPMHRSGQISTASKKIAGALQGPRHKRAPGLLFPVPSLTRPAELPGALPHSIGGRVVSTSGVQPTVSASNTRPGCLSAVSNVTL